MPILSGLECNCHYSIITWLRHTVAQSSTHLQVTWSVNNMCGTPVLLSMTKMIMLLLVKTTGNTMEQSPSCEAGRHLTSPEIPRNWWKSNVHYTIHNSPPPLPTLRRVNPVLSQFHFLKVHFGIIMPCTSKSSKWSVYLKCPHQNPVCTSPVSQTCHMLRQPHFLIGCLTNISWWWWW